MQLQREVLMPWSPSLVTSLEGQNKNANMCNHCAPCVFGLAKVFGHHTHLRAKFGFAGINVSRARQQL